MKKYSMIIGMVLCLWCTAVSVAADSSDSFGFDETQEESSAFSIDMGGKLSLGGPFFFNDFKAFKNVQPSSLIEGKLHVHATAPLTEAYFGVRLNAETIAPALGESQTVFPVRPQIAQWIDETYLKLFLGQTVISGGIQKMNWGRAENMSVLDIVNPRDLTDLTLLYDPQQMKIARPLLSVAAYLPYDIKAEGVFLPVFEGNHIAAGKDNRWYSQRFDRDSFNEALGGGSFLDNWARANPSVYTGALEYAQGGGRFTASVGGMHDFGVQYFYGRLPELAFKAEQPIGGGSYPVRFSGLYNPYHHIGLDYGAGIGPVALSAELAANITSDLSGDNPSIYNPFIAWNACFGYSAPLGFSLNITAAETIRLNHKRIGSNRYDIESGRSATDTEISLSLSQTLLRNSFEWKLSAIIGLEDADFCIMPGIHWQFATLLIDCNAGIFGGRKTGQLGQFHRNSFIRLAVSYEF